MKMIYRASLLGITYPEYDSPNPKTTWANVCRDANQQADKWEIGKLSVADLKLGGWRVKKVLELESTDIVFQPAAETVVFRKPGFFQRLLGLLAG